MVALMPEPYWCWHLERADSPWYPTLRLFRQKRLRDWRPVFEAIADELRKLPGRSCFCEAGLN